MSDKPTNPTRGINWTQVLANACIPELAWNKAKEPDAPAQKIQPPEPEDRENWMHV